MRARSRGGRQLRDRRPLVALLLSGLLAALLVAPLAGCATRSSTAAPSADARDATAGCASGRGNKRSRFREMTWGEYYVDVRERAWRNGATIIWITPPKVKRSRSEPAAAANSSGASSANTTACAR